MSSTHNPTRPEDVKRYTTAANAASGTCVIGPKTTAVFVLATDYDALEQRLAEMEDAMRNDYRPDVRYYMELQDRITELEEEVGWWETQHRTDADRITELEAENRKSRELLGDVMSDWCFLTVGTKKAIERHLSGGGE